MRENAFERTYTTDGTFTEPGATPLRPCPVPGGRMRLVDGGHVAPRHGRRRTRRERRRDGLEPRRLLDGRSYTTNAKRSFFLRLGMTAAMRSVARSPAGGPPVRESLSRCPDSRC